jgi:hypothetical protein
MKTILSAFMFLSGVIFSSGSFAIDAGTASGTLQADGDVVTLSHAYAQLHDNAEGWLDFNKEMRILVSDREVDQDTLAGLNPFFTLSAMVRQGSVRGVLIRFDPAKPKSILVTVLYPPKDQRNSLANRTISDSERSPLENLHISELRVSASVNRSSEGNAELGWLAESYSFRFSAPLFREAAVTATLKERQALNSPQVKAILARAAALQKCDIEKTKQYSTERFIREIEDFMAQSQEEARKMMRESGKDIEQSVKKGKLRLIVRGNRASLIVDAKDGKSMFGLIKKDGNWIVD